MNEPEVYFSNEALARFLVAEGRKVDKVVCHLWQNSMDQNGSVELIDNVELHFSDGHKLTISCNENGDGLTVIDFNYKETARHLHEEFEGKIKLFAVNASATSMWDAVIGKTLQQVRVTKQADYYKADTLVLDFGEEKREISIGPLDGLVIDYFEED